MDDENTWHVWYQTYRPEGGAPPQGPIPVYEVPLTDEKGESLRDYVDGQDVVAWITQGRISDRSREHLGRSDLGVILLRKLYAQQMERVARGEDPLCTYRARHDVIDLSMERDKFGSAAEFRQMWTRESSIRYSPIRAEISRLFGDPVPAWS
jgi:5,5'-dehydrodivanillate O-demethylase oxygenase subunit